MAENPQSVGAGGFIRTLPSPAPNSTPTTKSTTSLPHPRVRPLLPGSAKEDKVRNYVEGQLRYISRRYIKSFAVEEPGDTVVGYHSMGELCRDVEALVNILWLSATPSLQIPYLLNIAGSLTEWVTHFPPSPKPTFSLLGKLDHCFASLLLGRVIATKEPLPGFEAGSNLGMSVTDKIRCKSIVEQTRLLIVEVMSRPQVEELGDEEMDDDRPVAIESDSEGLGDADDDDDDLYMGVATVYENTLVQLGESL